MQAHKPATLPIRTLSIRGLRPRFLHGKLLPLLVSLILLLLFYPFFEGGFFGAALLNLLVSITLLTGAYVLSSTKRRFLAALAVGVPALATTWANVLWQNTLLQMASSVLEVLFYGYIALAILKYIIRAKEVTEDEIYGAICVYLLLGIIFASVYSLAEVLHPGSFYLDPNRDIDRALTWGDLLYYSFVTMMTIGYGDITPLTANARSLSILQAAAGVLFVAITIARLVGIYSAQPVKPKMKDFKLDEFIKNV